MAGGRCQGNNTLTSHDHSLVMQSWTSPFSTYVQCGGKQIPVYTVRHKEMSGSDIRPRGGKEGKEAILNLTCDTRESFTEEVTLELSIDVCGRCRGWGRTPMRRRCAVNGKGQCTCSARWGRRPKHPAQTQASASFPCFPQLGAIRLLHSQPDPSLPPERGLSPTSFMKPSQTALPPAAPRNV